MLKSRRLLYAPFNLRTGWAGRFAETARRDRYLSKEELVASRRNRFECVLGKILLLQDCRLSNIALSFTKMPLFLING